MTTITQQMGNKDKGWGFRSLTFWLCWLFSVGLIALGANGLIQPEAASHAFGLGLIDSADSRFVMVKATRDLVLGITIAVFAWFKMKKSLMLLALVSSIIPLVDGILVLTQGGDAVYSWQHFVTAFLVLFTVVLLWREQKRA